MPGPYTSYNTNSDYPNEEHQGGGQGMGGDWLAALLSIGYDMYASNRMHKQNIKSENKARKWNLEQWHRQNLYNHPLQQMERLLAAGLNPNLIYGSSPGSAVGNAGAVAPGKAVARMQMPFGAIGSAMQTGVQQAQTNNLKAQSNLHTANAIKSISQGGLAKAQENQISKLLSGNLEIQQEQIKQMNIGTFLKTLEKTGKSKYYLANMAAETNKAVAEGKIAKASVELARLNERLAKQGIRPTDPLWIKLMGQVFGLDLDQKNPTVRPEDKTSLRGFIELLMNNEL
tara:strand:- start:714 stop:1571 length:858 start_codon:yes stop_codon:yes gene_type:complete